MNWVDIVIFFVVALSATIGFFRGFLREAFGLAAWVLAFYLAFVYAPRLAALLVGWIDIESVRLATAFGVIVLSVIILGAIGNALLGRLIKNTGFAGTDRILGIGFGLIRGIALLVILVMLAGATSIPHDPWWRNSLFIDHLETAAIRARHYLPPNLARSITYPDRQPVGTATANKG